jgi:Protein of unknown function (DUF4239)
MSSIEIGAITFGCVFGGALLGIIVGRKLPEHHLTSETKDVVRLGMALVGTIGALVLSFFVTSAKGYHDRQVNELTQMSAKVVVLGRILQFYGPEASEARQTLRAMVGQVLLSTWPNEQTENAQIPPRTARPVDLYNQIEGLAPKEERQRAMQSQASGLLISVGEVRWLMIEEAAVKINPLVILVLDFWLTVLFVSWGLYSPRNATALTALVVTAVAVSAAIFLIVELYTPYTGILRVSSVPLRMAYETLTQ